MMGRKIKEKTLYLGLKFVDNLDLPKDYRLKEIFYPLTYNRPGKDRP